MGNYSSELPIWLAEGVKPPENMLKVGWKASQKPPADYFNWFFNRTHVALSELQEKTATEKNVTLHTNNKSNPHAVTATQVGLGEVINQKQATKLEFDAHDNDTIRHTTLEERTKWNAKAEGKHTHSWGEINNVPSATLNQQGIVKLSDSVVSADKTVASTASAVKQAYDRGSQGITDASSTQKNLDAHVSSKSNPHSVTASQVGLSNVKNYDVATTTEAIAGSANNKYMTPFLVSTAIKQLQAITSVNGKTGAVTLTKNDIGLGSVDNTKQATKAEFDTHNIDTTKHITTAERTKWNAKAETTSNVASATKLLNARQINGVAFDGTKNIDILSDPKNNTIPSNSDLNLYILDGLYNTGSDGETQTIKNCPFSNSSTLYVSNACKGARTNQLLMCLSTGQMQSRWKNEAGSWSNWRSIALANGNLQTGLYAQTASKLSTARNIAGISFDGTASITIPAGNVGAYTKEEADAKINQRQKNLDAHTSNKSNPHGVTAAQLGAVTLNGSQTISGDKNFTGALKVKGVSIVDLIYPVGAIYQSTKSTSPATLFGGTWERIKGKVLVGVDESDTDFSTVSKTGGAKTHKLSDGELPAKNGIIAFHGAGGSGTVVERCSGVFTGTSLINNKYHTNQSTSGGNSYGGVNFDLGGKNESHNNLQPYTTVYMWVRTA